MDDSDPLVLARRLDIHTQECSVPDWPAPHPPEPAIERFRLVSLPRNAHFCHAGGYSRAGTMTLTSRWG